MKKEKMQIIVEKPTERSGVYVIVNIIQKKAYVGETKDFYRRLCEHIRSIAGMENSSNANLVAEECKTFEIFSALIAKYDKAKSNADGSKDWIIDETIYMYLFRKNGFTLYNGDSELKDNTGKNREFLLNPEIPASRLYNELMKFLEGKEPRYCGYNTWDEFIKAAEDEMGKYLNISIKALAELDGNNRLKKWKDRVKEKTNQANYYIIEQGMSESKINKICNQLSAELLTIADMEKCGLSGKSLDEVIELINEGNFGRIVVSKFGHYLDQGPATILMTKAYDIQHNRLGDLEGLDVDQDDKDKGICFWALKRLSVDDTRDFLSFSGENKGPRYVIMPYTMSKVYEKSQNVDKEKQAAYQSQLNPQESESLDEFFYRIRKFMEEKSDLAEETFAFEYALDEKKIKNKKYSYPKKMFPEVISKSEINKAFLISELSYFKGSLKNVKDVYKFFMSHTKNYGEQNELATTLKGSKSHSCAMLKVERKEEFVDYLKAEVKADSDVTSFLIAKLEYPYIIALQ